MSLIEKIGGGRLFSRRRTDRDGRNSSPQLSSAAKIYARAEHTISRKAIAESALKVLYRLNGAGFEAYLVGGAVRDLLLDRVPKDFDIATDARPEQVRELFRNSRIIGRRFRLVHVRFGREVIEVATFRAAPENDTGTAINAEGRILRDNVYGRLEDDVWRRDFTVNALYYNIADFSVVDYVGGVDDLRETRLRLIGDPAVRFREDPVRILRAIRFASKLDLKIDPDIEQEMVSLGELISDVSPARLFDELTKIFHSGAGQQAFTLLEKFGLMAMLFPGLAPSASANGILGDIPEIVWRALENTDRRVAEDKTVTPAFIFAAIMWAAREREVSALASQDLSHYEKDHAASEKVIRTQVEKVAIPRRFTSYIREMWTLQNRFEHRTPKRVAKLSAHRRFRAAYDFLLLRAAAGEAVEASARWWQDFEQADGLGKDRLIAELGNNRQKARRRKPRGQRRDRSHESRSPAE